MQGHLIEMRRRGSDLVLEDRREPRRVGHACFVFVVGVVEALVNGLHGFGVGFNNEAVKVQTEPHVERACLIDLVYRFDFVVDQPAIPSVDFLALN